MNALSAIRLTQFRNYDAAEYQFPAAITCITGPNGSGKTNLLDAVYFLCYSKSYFTPYHQQCARIGTHGFRLEGMMEYDDRPEQIVCRWKDGAKEISRNGVAYDRIQDFIGRHTAVMIAPDDLALINDGGELRRKWIDGVLGQTSRDYLEHLFAYQRVLAQRRAWLKQQAVFANADAVQLEYYDAQLAEHGAAIYAQRAAFLTVFLPVLRRQYRILSGAAEMAEIQYQSHFQDNDYSTLLRNSLQSDVRMQRTQYGVHRDELQFLLSSQPVRQYASQGQKKSFLFALKLAQYEYLYTMLHRLPILLLDDVFEKLDQQRMEALLSIIRGPGFGQVLLTDTHPERVKAAFGEGVEVGMIEL